MSQPIRLNPFQYKNPRVKVCKTELTDNISQKKKKKDFNIHELR